MLKATVKKGKGKKAGQYYAVLSSTRVLAHTEHYTRRNNLVKMLRHSFSQFKIIDDATD